MPKPSDYKTSLSSRARIIETSLYNDGHAVTHSQALDAIARLDGHRDFRTALATNKPASSAPDRPEPKPTPPGTPGAAVKTVVSPLATELIPYGASQQAIEHVEAMVVRRKWQLHFGTQEIKAVVPLTDGTTIVLMRRGEGVRYTCLLVIPAEMADHTIEDDVRTDRQKTTVRPGETTGSVATAEGPIKTWRIAADQTVRMAEIAEPGESIVVAGWRTLEGLVQYHQAHFARQEQPTSKPETAEQALATLIGAIDRSMEFGYLEGGCDGNGQLVRACRAIGKPVPPNLAAWLKHGEETSPSP